MEARRLKEKGACMLAWRNGTLASIPWFFTNLFFFVSSILKIFCFFPENMVFLHKKKGLQLAKPLLMRSSLLKKLGQLIGFLIND